MKLSTIISALPAVIISVLFSSCVLDDESENGYEISTGSRLPKFEVFMNDGSRISDNDFTGKTGVIIFFNTECSDCSRELPLLQKAYEATWNISLWVAIARDENEEPIAGFWEENGLTIPYSPQPDRRIYNQFATTGIPRIYITDGTTINTIYTPDNIPASTDLIKVINGVK